MAIPDYQTLMLPVLKLIAGGRQNISECLPDIRRMYDISEDEAAELVPSGRKTVLANRAHWARSYLSKAGLLSSPKRNVHEATEAGRRLLAQNPERIDNKLLSDFEGFEQWRVGGDPREGDVVGEPPLSAPAPDTASIDTPEDRMRTAYAELTDALADALLETTLQISPQRFEQLVVQLLIAMGYGKGDPARGKAVGRSGDGGIDGIVNEDALGLDAVYIQAKRHAPENKVSRPDLQAFVGAMTGEGATKGVFFTTSAFTAGAVDYVRMVQQRIVLIDGPRLVRLMIEHGVGVRPQQTYVVMGLDEAAFDDV